MALLSLQERWPRHVCLGQRSCISFTMPSYRYLSLVLI